MGGGSADACLSLVKNLPGKFLFAPLVSCLGDDSAQVKGLVASPVAFFELRGKCARTLAHHRSRSSRARGEESAVEVELVLNVERLPAVREMAALQWRLRRLPLDEADTSDVLSIRKDRPGSGAAHAHAPLVPSLVPVVRHRMRTQFTAQQKERKETEECPW